MIANRMAYGEALVELGNKYDNLYVLDADLGKATCTLTFKNAIPNRYIDCGIAEQNMMCIAAGLASCGKISFATTFAIFTSMRAVEQVRNGICYPGFNVKVVGTHAGIEIGADGATHQAIEDVAIMRSLPNISVFVPADPVSTKKITYLMAENIGPMYMRLGREPAETIYTEDAEFAIGKSNTLADGDYAAIIAYGSMVAKSLEAAKELEKQGKKVRVLDMYSIKPIDKEAIIKAAKETRGIVTVEDHSIVGGLGGAVSEVVTDSHPTRVIKIGIKDCFGRSGQRDELFEMYGLTVKNIVDSVNSL